MRKIHSFHVITVDGYDEGPNQEFDWPLVDEEFNAFAIEQLDAADMLMFGRRTYGGMAAYWPTPAAEHADRLVAARMNGLPKIVVSRTLERADWADTRVVADIDEVRQLKRDGTGEVVIMGSSALVVSLVDAGLLDEIRVMVNPIVLGAGRSLFHTAEKRIGLTLLRTRPFTSSNVLLTYRPAAG
jgi:dihydrofolate reductase